MLLRNESLVKHYITVNLVFDDNTNKTLDIHEGEIVKVKYRKNGHVECGVGIIRQIKPFVRRSYRCNRQVQIESAYILLDMSQDNLACIDKIDLCDIIDIEFIYPDCPCPIPPLDPPKNDCNCRPGCGCGKEELPPPPQHNCQCDKPHYSCITGSALTNRGVIGHG